MIYYIYPYGRDKNRGRSFYNLFNYHKAIERLFYSEYYFYTPF